MCLNLLAKEVKKRVVPRVRTMEKFQNDVLVMKISQVFLLFGVYIFLMLVDWLVGWLKLVSLSNRTRYISCCQVSNENQN